tara:strand:+ start:2667 stop:5006 length:2340 start_codon:yes stop_codon:yes gene_type:complete
MAYQDLDFTPGITKEGTEYSDRGRWTDGNLVRFRKGRVEKMGGWRTTGNLNTGVGDFQPLVGRGDYYLGHSRQLGSWRALDGGSYTGVGTELKFYIRYGDSFYDVTPVRRTTSATNSADYSGRNNLIYEGATPPTTKIIFAIRNDADTGHITPAPFLAGENVTFSQRATYTALGSYSGSTLFSTQTITSVSGSSLTIDPWRDSNGDPVTNTGTPGPSAIFISVVGAGDAYQFSCVDGSSTITVSGTGEGAVLNDFVTFSDTVSLSGSNITAAVLDQEYQVKSLTVDSQGATNGFTFEARDPNTNDPVIANLTVTSGGTDSSTEAQFQINVGLNTFLQGTGWGAGVWSGNFGWGGDSQTDAVNQLRVWTADNFGENLIACARGLGIYRWKKTDGFFSGGKPVRMTALVDLAGASKVPTVALAVTVSEVDRHLIVLGADPLDSSGDRTGVIDPMLVAFSDSENELEFESLSTNSAGDVRLSSGSRIIGSIKNRQETVIFTDTAVYSMQFIGPPLTFAINLINEGSGLIGPKASVNAEGGVFFASKTGFHRYSGSVQSVPCSVQEYIFSDLDFSQAYKCFMGSNSEFNEIWFYYPSMADNTGEVSRYAIYNYIEQTWSIGSLVRYAWQDAGVDNLPLATITTGTDSGRLYQHEDGFDDDESPMAGIFIQSADIDISQGNNFMFVRSMIPDVEFKKDPNQIPSPTLSLEIKTRKYPNADLEGGTPIVVNNDSGGTFDGVYSTRVRSRQVALYVYSPSDGGELDMGFQWRLGTTRIDVTPSGSR